MNPNRYRYFWCSTLQDKMDEMNRLNCQPPDVAFCAGWQI